jgi:hypothetical protein
MLSASLAAKARHDGTVPRFPQEQLDRHLLGRIKCILHFTFMLALFRICSGASEPALPGF